MKAAGKYPFSFKGEVYNPGDDVTLTTQDDIDYLKKKGLIKGSASGDVEPKAEPIGEQGTSANITEKVEKTPAKEKKNITKP